MACNISGRAPGITASIAPRRDRDPVVAWPCLCQPAVADRVCGKIPVALPASPLVPLEPADPTEPAKINGETSHDRAIDAEGRLEDHLPAVPVHAGELCRQDRGRPRRRADHGRAEAFAGTVRPARLRVFL